MRIVVPYTLLHEATRRSVLQYTDAGLPEWIALDEDDPQAYYCLLCELWAGGEDFMLVEHDMELLGTEVQQFTVCPNYWCTFPYAGSQPIWPARDPQPRAARTFRCALGCTRFRAELMAELPEVVSHIAKRKPQALTAWNRLDSQIASYLFQHGKRTCEHEPHVPHHHVY